MVDWKSVNTILLDLDGVLLDLRFDNWFWREHVPAAYAGKSGLDLDQAKAVLYPKMRAVQGTLSWYSVDYWSETLGLDVVQLKADCAHRVALRPHAVEFLTAARATKADVHLTTNAHQKTVEIKFQQTGLSGFFDSVICSHHHGAPKEDQQFWCNVFQRHGFEPTSTLFIDDNLDVLRAARRFGIVQLFTIHQPDSGEPGRDNSDFVGIKTFEEIMPVPCDRVT